MTGIPNGSTVTGISHSTAEVVGCMTAVMVELTGITRPAAFSRLPEALAALWNSMRVLPLETFDSDCFREHLTGPDAAERARELLDRDGEFALAFTLAGGSRHVLRLRRCAPPALRGARRD